GRREQTVSVFGPPKPGLPQVAEVNQLRQPASALGISEVKLVRGGTPFRIQTAILVGEEINLILELQIDDVHVIEALLKGGGEVPLNPVPSLHRWAYDQQQAGRHGMLHPIGAGSGDGLRKRRAEKMVEALERK